MALAISSILLMVDGGSTFPRMDDIYFDTPPTTTLLEDRIDPFDDDTPVEAVCDTENPETCTACE